MADDEILSIREVAALLKIGEKTAYTMAQSGELPGLKVRGHWRFRRSDIDQWIGRQVGQSSNGSGENGARENGARENGARENGARENGARDGGES